MPKVKHREMQTLTADQLAAFFREAKASGVFEFYYIELATGLRRGELLGLKCEDIDLEQGVIQVRRQVARVAKEVVEAPLKTKNSYRSVTIGAEAAGILKGQKEQVDGVYVFPSPTGGPISPDSVLHMLHRVLKRAGLPKVRFHDLRHPNVKIKTKDIYHCLLHMGTVNLLERTISYSIGLRLIYQAEPDMMFHICGKDS